MALEEFINIKPADNGFGSGFGGGKGGCVSSGYDGFGSGKCVEWRNCCGYGAGFGDGNGFSDGSGR